MNQETLIRKAVAALARAMLCEGCGSQPEGRCRACGKTRDEWLAASATVQPRMLLPPTDRPAQRMAWADRAACKGMDLSVFFPPDKGEITWAAGETCARCPVLAQCRSWAIENREYGTWGGTAEPERAALWRTQRAAASRQGRRAA